MVPVVFFNLKGKDQNLEVILPKDEIEGCLEDSNLTELKSDNICLKLGIIEWVPWIR